MTISSGWLWLAAGWLAVVSIVGFVRVAQERREYREWLRRRNSR